MEGKILDIKPDTKEWLEYRFNHIGSSDAPIIVGKSPFKTRYQLWLEKVMHQSSGSSSYIMQKGKDLEPVIINTLNKKHSVEFNPVTVEHEKHSYMSASLDAYSKDLDLFYEIKLANKDDHENLDKHGIIPIKYVPQIEHQMYVTGIHKCYYLSYYQGDVLIKEHELCKLKIRSQNKLIRDFWQLVIDKKEPALSKKDYVDINDRDLLRKSLELESLKNEIAKLTKKSDAIKDQVFTYMHEMKIERANLGKFKVRKQYRKKNVDYKRAAKENNINLEDYRPNGFSEYWIFK